MKKFAISASLIVFVILLTFSALTGFCFGIPSQYDQTFLAALPLKYNRLNSIEGRKIVVIGGSSVAFGIDSELMERELNIPVVNFGLYASLGTKIMLDLAKDSIKENDIVIIAPEQERQTLSMYFNPESTWQAVDSDFSLLKKIDKSNSAAMVGSSLQYTSQKYEFWRKDNKPDPKGVYNIKSFNEKGDIVYPKEYNIMVDGYDKNIEINFDTSVISPEFIDYLNLFNEVISDKSAKTFFSFSPMNRNALKEGITEDTVQNYYNYLQEKLDFPVMSNPNKYIMDEEWFYDTNFHLNNSGVLIHTANLVNDIKLLLKDNRETNINIPQEKPISPKDEDFKDDEVQNDYRFFIFEQTTYGLKIVGLSELGKEEKALSIPRNVSNIKVLEISENAFASSTVLEEIIIFDNIKLLQNGCFGNAINLKRIIMASDNPDDTPIDSDLLLNANSDLYIYVDESAYGDYVSNYFWGNVARRIKIK